MAKSTAQPFFPFFFLSFHQTRPNPGRERREGLRSTNAINPPDVLKAREPRFKCIYIYILFTRKIKNIPCLRFFLLSNSQQPNVFVLTKRRLIIGLTNRRNVVKFKGRKGRLVERKQSEGCETGLKS